MKNQYGISMIALVVTVIVIVILASIVTISSLSSIEEAGNTKIDMEIRNLKDAVADRMINYERNSSKYPLIGEPIENVADCLYYIENMTNAEIEEAVRSLNSENTNYYRMVDSETAKLLGVESIHEEHYYIVDYYSGKVYGTVNIKAMESATY